MIATYSGLIFPPARHAEVEQALRRALPSERNPDRLRELLAKDDEAREALIAELTVGETYFFRDPEQFALLRQLIPQLTVENEGRPVRIWCAGCASGEEPYSIAILCDQLRLSRRVEILATDLSRTRLARAQHGTYRPWSFRGVATDVIHRYFNRQGTHLQLRAEMRERVEFRYLNLAEDRFPSLTAGVWGIDLILCRNVLMYFDRATVARVAKRLVDTLAENGWLLLGASDPAIGELTDTAVTLTTAGLAYRRRGARAAVLPLREPSAPGVAPAPPMPLATTHEAGGEATAPPWRVESMEPHDGPAPRDTGESPVVAIPAASAETERMAAAAVESDDEAAALAALAAAYAARDYDLVHALGERLVARRVGGVTPWLVRIRAFANRGNLEDAGLAAAAALELHRDSAELLYLHAVLLAQSGRHAEAAAAARRAL
ncbi:MAG: CheR family methyltransferase, partial [Longimicrobiales bacterium]